MRIDVEIVGSERDEEGERIQPIYGYDSPVVPRIGETIYTPSKLMEGHLIVTDVQHFVKEVAILTDTGYAIEQCYVHVVARIV